MNGFCSRKNILVSVVHGFRPNYCEGFHSTRILTERNYYDVLNVKSNCKSKEIRDSFISLAKKYHPDTNPNDPKNHARFIEIQKAYSVLSTPSKRQEYDLSIMGVSPYASPYKRARSNDPHAYEDYFNEEYRELFYRSRNQGGPDPIPRVGKLQVTLLLFAFTTVGATLQYFFLKWVCRRNFDIEMEKHSRGTASYNALKDEMDKNNEEYDIQKLRNAYFKEVGTGAIGLHLVPQLIRPTFPAGTENSSRASPEDNRVADKLQR